MTPITYWTSILTQHHGNTRFKPYGMDRVHRWSCSNVLGNLGMLKYSKQWPRPKAALWTFTEHSTGISWMLRVGLTMAATHSDSLVSVTSVPDPTPCQDTDYCRIHTSNTAQPPRTDNTHPFISGLFYQSSYKCSWKHNPIFPRHNTTASRP